jgi:uncharacterized protein
MVDQVASAAVCRGCGAQLNERQVDAGRLCDNCAVEFGVASYAASPGPGFQQDSSAGSEMQRPDPDNPPWGPITGISVWVASFLALAIVPLIALGVWIVIEKLRGAPLPNFTVPEEIQQWVLSPNAVLVQVLSTCVAHGITIAICWAVVTKLKKRPFLDSLGWVWGGHSKWYWLGFSFCILVGLQIAAQGLARVLPEAPSPFDQMLRTSAQIRIAVAVMAIFTAPFVEEVVYRGVLYSALRKRLGQVPTVVLVTIIFGGVHIFQNFGAWVSISGLMLLSLALTMVRARTKSVLPCFFIHTVNNTVASILILITKSS